MLAVLITNAYVLNRRLWAYKRTLRRHRAPVIVMCESHRVGWIRGYKRFSAPESAGRDARDTAVYLRRWLLNTRRLRVVTSNARTLTRDVGGYAHARTVTEVRFVLRGERWAVFAVHANPGRLGKAAAQNALLIEQLAAMMRDAEADGLTPVAAGDWNRRDHEAGNDSPHALPGRVLLEGIDGLVVPHGCEATLRRFPTPPGSNHPLLKATISPTTKEKP